jgi:peptidase E
MDLEQLIINSYGHADHLFAVHPLDIERAYLSIVRANEEHVGFEEYVEKHRNYLQSLQLSPEHIESQLDRVKDITSYFKNN